ncbi:hypothetical protein [Marinibactrum halimedae]|uniref:Uncharacterized protein n=1 Tax=Marinibactrum halimedae TaxID=1444977 RepID=A0AA37WME2_9GAMM|nr:hypothetical protein [Marinibactrum halimedae]MCD9461182.1 hypothetical protein [Marinibactrum halimedae]GLS26195.1 hypothetical protein GCM10007877_19100 [Marinibactrum halimedae]
MKNSISYRFSTAPDASRFLAEIKSGTVPGCQAKRGKDDHSIVVQYTLKTNSDFDSTAQTLDDLAEKEGGAEDFS